MLSENIPAIASDWVVSFQVLQASQINWIAVMAWVSSLLLVVPLCFTCFFRHVLLYPFFRQSILHWVIEAFLFFRSNSLPLWFMLLSCWFSLLFSPLISLFRMILIWLFRSRTEGMLENTFKSTFKERHKLQFAAGWYGKSRPRE